MFLSSHTEFQPLKSCMVGRCYPPEFFAKIPNLHVSKTMQRIAEETEEDYQKLINILKSFNIDVVRPEIVSTNDFKEYLYITPDRKYLYQPPPMQPRNYLFVLGDKLFMQRPFGEFYKDFYANFYESVSTPKFRSQDIEILRDETLFVPPSITRFGKDLYFDGQESLEALKHLFPGYRYHNLPTGGHSDSVFCIVKPGLIITLCEAEQLRLEERFPGWDIVYLPNKNWDLIEGWNTLKYKNHGRWWLPEDVNDDFVNYVDEYLDHWLGFVEETVFEVNMLIIDDKNVIISNECQPVIEAFRRHGITPHLCNFRHRHFWDGGLHCLTQDLIRDGECIDYFA